MCQRLIETYHLHATEKTDGGARPLHMACSKGHIEVVEYLLTQPTVIDTVNDEGSYIVGGSIIDDVRGGGSALWLACDNDHLPVVEELLKLPNIHMPTDRLLSKKFAILSILSVKIELSAEFPVSPHFPLFMTGNSGAGKSTLTAVMLKLTSHIFLSSRDGCIYSDMGGCNFSDIDGCFCSKDGCLVSGVKLLTAGICPATCSL